MKHIAIGSVVLAAATAFSLSAAQAQPMFDRGIASVDAGKVETVQWRRGHGGYRGRYRGGWRGRGYGHHRGWGRGAAVGAGIAGLAAGALIGGAIAGQPGAVYETDPVYSGGDMAGYCASRFKSWDPASGTYLGYDGLRHPCP